MSSLKRLLRLTRVSDSSFITQNGAPPPPGGKGVFGGQLVAQSLWAAILTSGPAFEPSSMHCYFVVKGDTTKNIRYAVESLREGTNFEHRQVRAYQLNRLVFVANVLLHKSATFQALENHEDGTREVYHVTKADDDFIPFKETVSAAGLFEREVLGNLERYVSLSKAWASREFSDQFLHRFVSGAVEYRFPRDVFDSAKSHNNGGPSEHIDHLDYYQRVRPFPAEAEKLSEQSDGSEMDDPRFNYVVFAYLSDAYLLLTLPYFHQLPLYCSKFSVSLDHTIHFHQRPPVFDWMALRVTNPRSIRGRHLVNGEYFNAATKSLIASVRQEGLVIYDSPSEIRARF